MTRTAREISSGPLRVAICQRCTALIGRKRHSSRLSSRPEDKSWHSTAFFTKVKEYVGNSPQVRKHELFRRPSARKFSCDFLGVLSGGQWLWKLHESEYGQCVTRVFPTRVDLATLDKIHDSRSRVFYSEFSFISLIIKLSQIKYFKHVALCEG